MTTNDNDFCPKKPVKFICQECDFKCSYNKDFKRHLNTKKHKSNILTTNDNEIGPETSLKIYECQNCEKVFNDRAGLWRHKKKCYNEMTIDGINIKDKDALVFHLLKQNGDLQNKLIELIIDTADEKQIPFQRNATSRVTGTDTDAFAYSNGGVPSALISLPLRYMHTTVEMVQREDVENVIKLIYETLLKIENNHDFSYFK